MSSVGSISSIVGKVLTIRQWRNKGDFCNGKRHPRDMPYRPYRRGQKRCHACGAKIGKIKCVRTTWSEEIADNIGQPNAFMQFMRGEYVPKPKRWSTKT